MAVIQGLREEVNSSLRTPNVLPDIILTDGDLKDASYLAVMDTLPKMATSQYEMKWEVDEYLPSSDTTSSSATATDLTIDVTTPNVYIPNDLFLVKETNELMQVESVDKSNSRVTFIRGLGAKESGSGQAAAAITSGAKLIRLSPSESRKINVSGHKDYRSY